ncbi:MAG: (2E,6E)-farnesyl diphosphate synthase [Gammaproteobacteria bacterium]|nr:(2E,6E)-farnesyl diphosphate synthase [Gammaproteobacteria bacterium]
MTAEAALRHYLCACQSRIETALDQVLPHATTQPERLHAAMRYATLDGGKRVRAVLVYGAGRALNLSPDRLDPPACAIELIHAYSLLHDDLPAMDDDPLRRGKPSCHVEFDEATAILAGDSLQALAFKVLCQNQTLQGYPDKRVEMIETLAIASGSRGMAGGQAMDLDAVGKELNLAQLENMHIHKTGALIRASVRLGTLSTPEEDGAKSRALDHYAKCIGLAFQVQDDILDVGGDTQTLGKTTGKDQAAEKPTYPALLGMQEARNMAQRLCEEATASLESLDEKADPLRWLAGYIIKRSH